MADASKPFVYEQVYLHLSDQDKLAWLQREMQEELGPEWERVKDSHDWDARDMANEAIFDNYAEQGRLMKKLGLIKEKNDGQT